jgi:hypothetical protein
VAGVVNAGAARGAVGVEGAAWSATEVVGGARETVEVGKAGDGGAAQGRQSDCLPLFRERSNCLGSWLDRQSLFRGRSDRLGSRSDHQSLFHGRSDRLGSRSDRQPLFCGRSDRQPLFHVWFVRQQQLAVESLVECEAPVVVWACEPLRESHRAVRCINR